MRYHKYKHKPGGYYVKRNRFGKYSTIPEKNVGLNATGCLGCLLPCLSVSAIIAGLFIIFL